MIMACCMLLLREEKKKKKKKRRRRRQKQYNLFPLVLYFTVPDEKESFRVFYRSQLI